MDVLKSWPRGQRDLISVCLGAVLKEIRPTHGVT